MDQGSNQHFLADIEGALDWWKLAGVDCDFLDEPTEWLKPPEEMAPPPSEWSAAREANAAASASATDSADRIDMARLPATLADFSRWWLSEAMLDAAPLTTRVAPQGKAGAEAMVIVEAPEPEDDNLLLSGPQGRLLDAILSAIGLDRDSVYLASVLPRAMPAPDWTHARHLGFGSVLLHHIALAAPRRLFVLGGNALSLLGHESPQRPAVSRLFNHEGQTVPLLASWGLASLLNQPRAKPVLWRSMLDWTARQEAAIAAEK